MIQKALKEAENSKFDRARIGAVIISGGRVLAKGTNKIRKHSFKSGHWNTSLHAECAAILDVFKNNSYKDLKNATMYVARIKKDGSQGMACPCKDCMQVIKNVGFIKRIRFTCGNGEIGEIRV